MYDARDPWEEHVYELAVHQDLDAAVEDFAEDGLIEQVGAYSSLPHQTDKQDQICVHFLSGII